MSWPSALIASGASNTIKDSARPIRNAFFSERLIILHLTE